MAHNCVAEVSFFLEKILTMKKEQNSNLLTNILAEQMLLGGILINKDHLVHIPFLKQKHFYYEFHQKLYEVMVDFFKRDIAFSVALIEQELKKYDFNIDVIEYCKKLATQSMMIFNIKDYANTIFDLYQKRELETFLLSAVELVKDCSINNTAIDKIEKIEEKLYEIRTDSEIKKKSMFQLSEFAQITLSEIEAKIKSKKKFSGLETGFSELDQVTSGLKKSDLMILAARPGMGKTAFALNLAINVCEKAKDDEVAVCIFSLEMSGKQLSQRIISIKSLVNSYQIESGKLAEIQYNSIRKALNDLRELKIFIDDKPSLTVAEIRAKSIALKRKSNLQVIIIDYLQLIKADNTSTQNRVYEVSLISRELKAIAKDLDITIIALSQLSRAVEQREDKCPMLSDLRDSGSIEQDADIVMFLYRENYYTKTTIAEQNTQNTADLIIAKNRHGQTAVITLNYLAQFYLFTNFKNSTLN